MKTQNNGMRRVIILSFAACPKSTHIYHRFMIKFSWFRNYERTLKLNLWRKRFQKTGLELWRTHLAGFLPRRAGWSGIRVRERAQQPRHKKRAEIKSQKQFSRRQRSEEMPPEGAWMTLRATPSGLHRRHDSQACGDDFRAHRSKLWAPASFAPSS